MHRLTDILAERDMLLERVTVWLTERLADRDIDRVRLLVIQADMETERLPETHRLVDIVRETDLLRLGTLDLERLTVSDMEIDRDRDSDAARLRDRLMDLDWLILGIGLSHRSSCL